jgi:hypothetical protein
MAQDISDYAANYLLDLFRGGKSFYVEPSSTPPNLDGTNFTPCGQGDKVRVAGDLRRRLGPPHHQHHRGQLHQRPGQRHRQRRAVPVSGVYDALTSGNFLWRITLTSALAWVNGQPVKIAVGDLTLSFPSS